MQRSPIALIALLLAALAGCGFGPGADAPLAFAPADTPFVFANLERIPERVSAPWYDLLAPLDAGYGELLQELRAAAADAPGSGSAARLLPLLEMFEGKLSAAGLEELGFRRDGLVAFYGIGLVPVLRLELGDEQALRAAVAELERRRGSPLPVGEVDGRQYWRLESAGGRSPALVFAVLGRHLVATLDFGAEGPPLAELLGLKRPQRSLLDSGELAAVNREYGLKDYGTLLIDSRRLAGGLGGEAQGAAAPRWLAGAGLEPSPACRQELAGLADAVPRVVSGYEEFSAGQVQVRAVAELRPDLATALQAISAPVPGLGGDQRPPLDFGFGIRFDRFAEFLQARADAAAASPYRCPWLAPLNEGDRSRQLAPLYLAAGWFSGLRVALSELRWTGETPEAVAGVAVVASPNPAALIGMAQGFLPQLAQLDLRPGGDPQRLDLGPLAGLLPAAAGAPYLAVGQGAVGLAVGADAPAQLAAGLRAPAPADPPLFHLSYDGVLYGTLMERVDKAAAPAGGPTDPHAAALRRYDQAVAEVLRRLDRVEFSVFATARGLELRERASLR